MRVAQRSRWGDTPVPADIWVGDSLGEMALYYGMADVAYWEGALNPRVGQTGLKRPLAVARCDGAAHFQSAGGRALAWPAALPWRCPDLAAEKKRCFPRALDLVRDGAWFAQARASAWRWHRPPGVPPRTAQAIGRPAAGDRLGANWLLMNLQVVGLPEFTNGPRSFSPPREQHRNGPWRAWPWCHTAGFAR